MKTNKIAAIIMCCASLFLMFGIALGVVALIYGYTYKEFDNYQDVWIKVFVICHITVPCLGALFSFIFAWVLFFSSKNTICEQTCRGLCWANFILMPIVCALIVLAFLYNWVNLWMVVMCCVSFYFFFKSIYVTVAIYSAKEKVVGYYKSPLPY